MREAMSEAGLKYSPNAKGPRRSSLRFFQIAFAVVALLLVPTVYWGLSRGKSGGLSPTPPVSGSQEFTPRGDTDKLPSFRVSCVSATDIPGPCAVGARMIFRVAPLGFSSFAAFAHAPDDKLIWYFPSEAQPTGQSLVGLHPSGVLPRAVSIGDGYAPGTYLIHGIFSNSPLTKEQVRQVVTGAPPKDIVVRKLSLNVER
jgi:hypothetical protein